MSSRHVPTKRLHSGVIFSAPDVSQRFPPDEISLFPEYQKPNNIRRRTPATRGVDAVDDISPPSCPIPEHQGSFAMFSTFIGDSSYMTSSNSGHRADFVSPKEVKATVCLPILRVASTTMIEGTLAHTTLIQSFHNPSQATIEEARHTFPLYDGAVVTDFECTIGDERRLRGVVKSKEQARQEYKKAVQEQVKVAALLEEQTPEIFKTSLGNIPPQTTVEIKIVYIQELKVVMMKGESTEGVVFIVPTSIAPRYGKSQAASEIACDGLDIKIKVLNDGKVNPDGCQEESGHLVYYDGPQVMEAPPSGNGEQPLREYYSWEHHSEQAKMNKDFVFVIQMQKGHEMQSQAILCPPDDAGMAAMMVSIRPSDLFRNAIIPQSFSGEILFLLDQSGSMRGGCGSGFNGLRKIDVLREAMLLVISGLPKTCSFNIISWGSETRAIWEQSRKHSPDNINEARDYISQIDSNLGGTDLLRAFKSTVQRRRDESNPTQIVVLTDGQLNADKPMEFVWKTRQVLLNKIRFFALGIGRNVPHRLIEGIAELGGGSGEIIDTTQNSRWHSRLNRLLKSALEPDSWDCNIDIGHGFEQNSLMDVGFNSDIRDTQQVPYFQAPHTIVTLHPFKFTSVFFLIKIEDRDILPKEVTITTTTKGAKKKTYRLPVKEVPAGNRVIHRLAAKALLVDLEGAVKRESSSSALVAENGQTIGTRYSVTSKWTSFVAVAQNEQEATTESSIVEHYKAMYDGVDFNELLIAAKLDSDNDSVTDDDSDNAVHNDTKYGSVSGSSIPEPPKLPVLRTTSSLGSRRPTIVDEGPSPIPLVVKSGDFKRRSGYINKGRRAKAKHQVVEIPVQRSHSPQMATGREIMLTRYSSTSARYPAAANCRPVSAYSQTVLAHHSPISVRRDSAYRRKCSENNVASPSPKSIDPLNWEVTVEHQNGQGLFELPESTKGLLCLHFCADTALVAVEKLRNILHSQGKEQEVSNAVLVDTIMVILCYQTHLALEEDIWDLMMERARDAVTEAIGQEILEVLEETLAGAMMHQHYTTVTGVNGNQDGGSIGGETCPVCDVRWQSLRTFFCPFDHDLDATHVSKTWAEFWEHQKETGHMVCPKESTEV
ncbi:unnamed protein product [Fusarium graminearum]|uniref:VIT domain-containing protein n=1 Tax=Gibberella zeae TaxID=5518 RepID=A0A2H3G0D3_GIBZA|nr:hypothetical protein FGRA07_06356 [Fusarium graminearum]CAF3520617.1 unnamed protein product [Fusarium graminearum]CAG1973601.1 unnamed protein product [Fusarium graminearum]CAG1999305.1 unnamed protein product [Fusarium graminearum]CAG2014802.1 unnamed protein product [Fusarium graminearum]